MHKLFSLVVVSCLAVLVPTVAHADKDFAEGRGATFDCGDDDSVNILHDGGTYVLTGACRQVNIEGSNVRLTVADVDQLSINGNGNIIKASAVGTVLINGNKNNVRWKSAKTGRRPSVATNGDGNSVAKLK